MLSATDLSLRELAQVLRSGALPLPSYLDALEGHFAEHEPLVRAFLPEPGRFDRLRGEAAALLARYPRPDARPSLFGVPIGVKDIFHVDGFVTRAGAQLDPALFQGPQAASVTALRAVGALILGKTVTTEFAYFAPGLTRNPHALDHTPGGSSSGSAAAVAARLTPLTLGTQTIGSISRPAAFCGVAGFKPSYGRISTAGIVPVSAAADHAGFFVPHPADALLVAPVLCRDWQPVAPDPPPVLAVPEGPYLEHAGPQAQAHFAAILQRLEAAGYTIARLPVMADFAAIAERHQDLVAAEAAQVHRDWYAAHADLYHPKTAALITRGQAVPVETLAAARDSRLALRDELGAIMAREGIDLWLSPPATGPAPRGLASTGDPIMNLPWTHAGLPTVALPAGRTEQGLPLGLQLAGGWYADERLLSWAVPLAAAVQPGQE